MRKFVRGIFFAFLIIAMCAVMTGCGKDGGKDADLPEEICREWVLLDDAVWAAGTACFEKMLDPYASHFRDNNVSYGNIAEVGLNIIPGESAYKVRIYDSSVAAVNTIDVKYTGEELVIFEKNKELGRCRYTVKNGNMLILTFTENGNEIELTFKDAAGIE